MGIVTGFFTGFFVGFAVAVGDVTGVRTCEGVGFGGVDSTLGVGAGNDGEGVAENVVGVATGVLLEP